MGGDFLALAPDRDNHFSPAYQYFLGILFLLFGGKLEVVWISQLLLGVLSSLLVYSISCQFFSRTAALISALLFTFYAPNWLYEGTLYRASLIVFLELATLQLLLAAGNRPAPIILVSSALVLGMYMQVRTNNVLIFPVALGYLWLRFKGSQKEKWLFLTGYALLVALICTPALFWVKEVRGHWGLYDKSGPENLLLSNTLDHSVRNYEHNETYKEVIKTIPLETGPIFKYVANTFLSNPVEFLVLYLKKTYYYFNNYEIPVTINFYLFQEFSSILGWGVPFGVIGALGILGGLIMWRRKGWTLLHSFFLTAFLMFLPFLVLSRYRLYSVPFLCMFSGYFLVVFREWIAVRNWKKIASSLVFIIGLGLIVKTEPFPAGKIRIVDLANMGSIYLNNDRNDDENQGLKFYSRANELSESLEKSLKDPRFIRKLFHDYYYISAIKLMERNEGVKILDLLETALTYDFSISNSHKFYAKILLRMKVLEGSLREALEALQLKPDSEDTHILLGTIYSKLSYSPFWVVFHWEKALTKLEGLKYEKLSKAVIEIRRQLGLPVSKGAIPPSDKKDLILGPLVSSLSPLVEFSSNPAVPFSLENSSAREINEYMTMLYQRLVLFPDKRKADIHFQLGILYWKKENRLSAAVHHLEKAWTFGRHSPDLLELKKLHNANLGY